jgi:hypothetical protein
MLAARASLFAACAVAAAAQSVFPVPPFSRALQLSTPCVNGSDVIILQSLLAHWSAQLAPSVSGCFDNATATSTMSFQQRM